MRFGQWKEKGWIFREILGRCDRRFWTRGISEDDLVNFAKLCFTWDVHKLRIGAGCIHTWEKLFWFALRKEGLLCFVFVCTLAVLELILQNRLALSRDPSASASLALGLKVLITTTWGREGTFKSPTVKA